MRHATYLTEVAFKKRDGGDCQGKHQNSFEPCEECTPRDLNLIGHWDIQSTIHIARSSGLGVYGGKNTKEIVVQYYAFENGNKIRHEVMERLSENFEGPSQWLICTEDKAHPLTDGIEDE
tara:strand:+ start:1990 stop:2349 length:360 start_codon:yes stop_codon:yes gene_type:complete